MEGSVERGDLLTVALCNVSIAPSGSRVPIVDPGRDAPRAEPAGHQIRIGPGPEDFVGRGIELTGDPDGRQLGIGLDLGLTGAWGCWWCS
jgi:hypothetical protein